MKKKYLVPAAAAAAALVLLAAALLWYGRSRSFRAVFPLSGSVEVSCRAQWTPEEGQGYARDLTGEQTSQVLGALKEQQLRRRYGDLLPWGGEGPVTSSMGESLLLTFRDRSGVSCELLFLGDRMWLHDLERDWGASYSLSGGQVFQEELTGVVYELVRPKAETVGTVYADLDGDGSDETVRLCAEETVEPDESGVPLVTDEAALRPYRLETEVDGRAAACALGDAGERYEGVARLFVTADRAGDRGWAVRGGGERRTRGIRPLLGLRDRLLRPAGGAQVLHSGAFGGNNGPCGGAGDRKCGGLGSELVAVPAERPDCPGGRTARSPGAGRWDLRRGTGGTGDPSGPAPVEQGPGRENGLAGDPGDLEGQRAGGGQPIF